MSTVVDDPVIEPEPTDETEPAADGGSQASSDRKFPVRRISFFDDDAADVPHLYMDGDIVMSHIVAALSSLFPEGEDYFVRSVRHYRDQVTDPVLKKQVAGFIGQEAIHGREHRAFNDRLDELGFPTKAMDRFTAKRLKFNERVAPPKVRLAVTAALEHYTATGRWRSRLPLERRADAPPAPLSGLAPGGEDGRRGLHPAPDEAHLRQRPHPGGPVGAGGVAAPGPPV